MKENYYYYIKNDKIDFYYIFLIRLILKKKATVLLTIANSGINQNTNIGGQFRVTQA